MSRKCWSCSMADQCNNWLDQFPYDCRCHDVFQRRDEANSGHAILGLCKGRHTLPQDCEGYVFEVIEDPTNVGVMYNHAYNILHRMNIFKLDLYVTGLTPALVAVISACKTLNIDLVLWHYDRDINDYYPQVVF